MTQIVLVVDKAPFRELQVPDVLNIRIVRIDGKTVRTRTIDDRGLTIGLTADMANERGYITKQLDVFVGKANRHSGFVASGLLRRASGKNSNCSGPEAFKNVLD